MTGSVCQPTGPYDDVMYPERIETGRLLLLRPTPNDRAELEQLFHDPRVMATLGGMRSPQQTNDLVERTWAHWLVHGFGMWIARDRASGAFVGRGGCRLVLLECKPELEVGYALTPDFWGRGLATELAHLSVATAFETLGVQSIVCFTSPTNVASQCVMKKAGFSYESDGDFMGMPQLIFRQSR